MLSLTRRAELLVRPLALIAVVAFLGSAGCGGATTYQVIGTARSAATDGTVEVEEQDGGNYMVTVNMQHLTPPERLGDGLTTYIVWFLRDGNAPSMAGALDYDPDDRTGTMMATTPYNEFRVRITAEESREVAQPSEVVVAEQEVSH